MESQFRIPGHFYLWNQNPGLWNPVPGLNPESTAQNQESKTILDSLTWGEVLRDYLVQSGNNDVTYLSSSVQAKKLLQEQLRISRTLTEKTAAESENEDDMETPVPEAEADADEDGYGNLVTSEDNPWKLDTTGAPHLAEMTSSLDNGNSR